MSDFREIIWNRKSGTFRYFVFMNRQITSNTRVSCYTLRIWLALLCHINKTKEFQSHCRKETLQDVFIWLFNLKEKTCYAGYIQARIEGTYSWKRSILLWWNYIKLLLFSYLVLIYKRIGEMLLFNSTHVWW